ncbi:CRISPR-associated endonuclease/helicase Cas3 [Clostridium collagenovorans DSM 3089]|uniref:CRISPR-associated endonuclease/helicase Cas3 n=1 Tax=Clostridium collagenovorans DSM 3089 TaxID=1121306 RepID=A0A1M5V6C3_9CLOT|nr:CRISPR-associated helicase/endonuclease Cas3 [Clostridium collagenovorans]SHH70822.1 CRISPR-associated endonuclease/helicase Cas3 [Clostridium collagenovorans DSM 3089]
MYFDNIKMFNLNDEVRNIDKIYAHLKENELQYETLENHMNLSLHYFEKLCKDKNLDNVFLNFQNSFFKEASYEDIGLWKELICNTIYMHDLGKINPNFQREKMKNTFFEMTNSMNSKHSLMSSIIYFNYYFNEVNKRKGEQKKTLLLFLLINSYVISRHHGYLGDIKEYIDKLYYSLKEDKKEELINYKGSFESISKLRNLNENFNKIIAELEGGKTWISLDIYIYTRFIYGILVSCDFYATSHYSGNKEIEDIGVIEDVEKYLKGFRETEVCKSINQYRRFLDGEDINPFGKDDINQLRTEMFLESEENLIKNLNEDIFFLEAPTGSGKTNTSINLAFTLLEKNKELNKIFYVFPFNTLVEQTKDSLLKVFNNYEDIKNEIAVINSITPIKMCKDEESTLKYEKSLLSRQFLHYPMTLTTHVNIFNYLFGIGREDVFPLVHMANGVLILDEIQSYRNLIWKEIIIFLKAYARLLNIKIIIMSATLPNLEKLSYDKTGFTKLIKQREKYFSNKLFKERVELDFSLLQCDLSNDDNVLLDKVIGSSLELKEIDDLEGKVVVEFIKKTSAMKFFKALNERVEEDNLDVEVLLITGDDNKIERKRIINKVKQERNLILVATQVIEAGVDIDMDIGFKDTALLDGEEQFLGRINRSCKKKNCKVFFFNKDEANVIYKNDVRKMNDLILKNDDIKTILMNKNFDLFYEKVMERLEEESKRINVDINIDDFRKEKMCKLKFEDIKDKMKLINDDRFMYTVFLNREIEDEDGKVISGENIWKEYKSILMDNKLPYAERRVKLSIIAEKLDYFTYQIDKIGFTYNDVLGNMIYIEDGEQYFENGKFSKELLQKHESFEFC